MFHRNILFPLLLINSCTDVPVIDSTDLIIQSATTLPKQVVYEKGTWEAFLQNLPVVSQPVVDYRGNQVEEQQKAFGVIPYDVGIRDLQQCADALMRLRVEYLFSQKRFNEISFRFTSGHAYSFDSYCAGIRPLIKGNKISFTNGAACTQSAAALRRYLDIVYTYAGTISLYRDLKKTNVFKTGTIIITPGSPGHCCIIIDEAVNSKGEKLYKLAEGYTPAQSIYILRNGDGPWHQLKPGVITTASYRFTNYQLRSFE